MIDIQVIRNQPALVKQAALNKKITVDIDRLLELDGQHRLLQGQIDSLNHERNQLSAQVSGKPAPADRQRGKALKALLQQLEQQSRTVTDEYHSLLERVPNLPSADTPVGESAADNKVLRTVGAPRTFDFAPREHWQLGEALGLIDTEQAARISGTRFAYLKGELVLLEFALIQFAFSVLTSETTLQKIAAKAQLDTSAAPFTPVIPPVFIKPDIFQRMARLEPREERYHIASDDLYLVGSAEHTLGPLHLNETLPQSSLPRRYAGFSSCFRREAGTYGADVRGILRLHQFDKLEMESFTLPEYSDTEQFFFVAIQEHLMQTLELPYRVVQMCTGEQSAPDTRQIDIETWLPGQQRYRETHTADLMTDYQARRLKTKVRRPDGQTEFVHMNDATAFAIGRTIIAIMENYQQADGSIAVPVALHRYLSFTMIPAVR